MQDHCIIEGGVQNSARVLEHPRRLSQNLQNFLQNEGKADHDRLKKPEPRPAFLRGGQTSRFFYSPKEKKHRKIECP